MTQRRLIPILLLLCLMLGQALSLAHGIEHLLPGSGDKACVVCLSTQHQYGPVAPLLCADTGARHALPATEPAADSPIPFHNGYHSRAPPALP